MKDNKNFKWTRNDIAKQYKEENHSWSWKKCWEKSKVLYKEINKMNNKMWKNNKTFFKYNIPFSFYDNTDDEFGDIFWDRESL